MRNVPVEMREGPMDCMTKNLRPRYTKNISMTDNGMLDLRTCPENALYLRVMEKHQNWCCEHDTVWDVPENKRFNIWKNMYTFYKDLFESIDKLYVYTDKQRKNLVSELDEKYEEDYYLGSVELNYRGGGDRYLSKPCLFDEDYLV